MSSALSSPTFWAILFDPSLKSFDVYDFLSLEECRDRLLNIAESFLTGTPLQDIDETYFPEDPGSQPNIIDNNTKPDFKVIEYEEKKSEKSKSKKNKTGPKKEPDFDWI